MSDLANQHCVPCRGGVPPLEGAALEKLSAQLPDWKVVDGHHIKKTFLQLARTSPRLHEEAERSSAIVPANKTTSHNRPQITPGFWSAGR
jgi:hypothetical protein